MTDTEQVEKIAELVTRKVLDGFQERLPCDKVQVQVHELETTINNGLKDDVAEIKEELREAKRSRRKFFISLAAVIFAFVLREFAPLLFGGRL
jgi:hypothetical protein